MPRYYPANRKPRGPGFRKVKILETGEVYNTVDDCARAIGGDKTGISKVIAGHRDTYLGFSFVWAGKSDPEVRL